MQGKRVFAFVPVGRLRNETRTVVRIGHTKSNKTLDQLFSGFDRPETILLEFGGDTIHNPHECCESLKSVMRGHLTFEGERFDLFANAGCLLGDKYFMCPDDVFDLSRKFEKIARYLFNDQQSTDPRYENQPGETSLISEDLVFGTFFNAGIRVFDVKNPFQPEEVAYFVPEIPEGAEANGINDIHVDENGIMYVVDRIKGGMYILELNI